MPRPKVYFDIKVSGGDHVGRVVIEVFTDTTPRMAENFRLLCTKQKGNLLHYKGSRMCFNRQNGTCSAGVYMSGCKLDLERENFIKRHDGPAGIVSMLPFSARFYISTFEELLVKYECQYMVVGQVVEGLDFVKAMVNEDFGWSLVISNCGQLPEPGVSKRPREEAEELARIMSNSNRGLSYIRKEIGKVNEPLLKVNATEFRKKRLGELEEMANYVKHNLEVLNGLEADVTSMKEHQGALLAEMELKILKWKEGNVVLKAISSLPDEVLDDIESAIKKLKSDRLK